MQWAVLQVDELGLDKCYEITVNVTAVNEIGNSTPEVFNITCDDPVGSVFGEYVIVYTLIMCGCDCGIKCSIVSVLEIIILLYSYVCIRYLYQ